MDRWTTKLWTFGLAWEKTGNYALTQSSLMSSTPRSKSLPGIYEKFVPQTQIRYFLRRFYKNNCRKLTEKGPKQSEYGSFWKEAGFFLPTPLRKLLKHP